MRNSRIIATAGVQEVEERNRKLGGILLGIILLLVAVAIIGAITLN